VIFIIDNVSISQVFLSTVSTFQGFATNAQN